VARAIVEDMADVFSPMDADQRARFLEAYRSFLHARDGKADFAGRRLDTREQVFGALEREPVRWQGRPPVDQAVFDRNHARRRPQAGLDQATLWALATAKANRGERYGVDYAFEHGRRATGARGAAAELHERVMLEELYHTRILQGALASLGLSMEVGQPGLSTRALVRTMVRLPEAISSVVVLCGEIVGVAVFSLLLEKASQLFAVQPPVLVRLEALFGQILVDEVGHVHFVRSRVGPAGLALARRLLPLVASGVLDDLPELEQLFGRARVLSTIRAAQVDAAAAAYADRFVPPA
jgi:hypothetical protein